MAGQARGGTPDHLKHRVKTLRRRMGDWDADALLVSNARDIRYLTGFIGDDSWAVVPLTGKVTVISDNRFREQIKLEAPHVAAKMRKRPLSEALRKLADAHGIHKIALQSAYVTLAQRKALVKALGAKRIVAVDGGLLEQRAIKDRTELAAIRKALAIQQQAFQNTLRFIKPGLTEQRVAAHLEYQMRSLGADGRSFPTIVAVDANAALPHAIPGTKKIRDGGLVLIDWGAKSRGYCSDLTRVVAVGKMPRRMAKVYQVVADAQRAAIAAIAPGVPLADVDAVARRVITKAGYGKQFGHSLGHGIGLDIHEQPVLAAKASGELQPGQVVTVEPGIYLPGVGGVRLEDDVLVTDRGYKVLSDLPLGLESAII